jgi:curved DNA-binding protein CbpA
MIEETYYTALGVAETASRLEIKKAYRSLLKKIHPDTVSTLSEETRRRAEDATQEIIEAFQVLADPSQRAEYDRYLAVQRALPNTSEDTIPPLKRCYRCGSRLHPGEPCSLCRSRRHRSREFSRHRRRRHALRDWMTVIGYLLLGLAGVAALIYCLYALGPNEEEQEGELSGISQDAQLTWNGAGDRDRTGDIQLGKLAFYR